MKNVKSTLYKLGISLMATFILAGNVYSTQASAQTLTLPSHQQIQASYTDAELDNLYSNYGWTLDKEYMLRYFMEVWQKSMGQSYQFVSFNEPQNFMGLSVTDYVLENARIYGGGVNLYYRDQVYHHNSPNQHFILFSIYQSNDPHLYFFGLDVDSFNAPTVMYAKTELNNMGHVIFEPTQNNELVNAFRYIYNADIASYHSLLNSIK